MKKTLQRVLLYSYMHIPIYIVLCSYLVHYEQVGDKLLISNENPSSATSKVLSVIRNKDDSGQRQGKIRM